MSAKPTRLAAMKCADVMDAAGFSPRTILNCGVGSTPERDVWLKRFPSAVLVGIDPRRARPGLWPGIYCQATLGEVTGTPTEYCSVNRSTTCEYNGLPEGRPCNGRHFYGTATALDDLVATHKLQGPFFVWMDIEGAEIKAINGGLKTFEQCRFINIERREWTWDSQWPQKIHDRLLALGFIPVCQTQKTDWLYQKK